MKKTYKKQINHRQLKAQKQLTWEFLCHNKMNDMIDDIYNPVYAAYCSIDSAVTKAVGSFNDVAAGIRQAMNAVYAIKVIIKDDVSAAIRAMPIENTGLSMRAQKVLAALKVKTVADALRISNSKLQRAKHCGPKTLEEIQTKLSALT
jgi:DNA-directed RNA polymerase alpha subunit